MFLATEDTVQCVASHLPGLQFEQDGAGYWLWGPPLKLSPDRKKWREELRAFSRTANAIVALTSLNVGALSSWGSVEVIDGDRRDHIMLIEPLVFETVVIPVTLSARGGGPQPRPLAAR